MVEGRGREKKEPGDLSPQKKKGKRDRPWLIEGGKKGNPREFHWSTSTREKKGGPHSARKKTAMISTAKEGKSEAGLYPRSDYFLERS